MDIISILANGLTIGTGFLSLFQYAKEKLNDKEFKALSSKIFNYDSIPEDLECHAEEADEYVSKHHDEFNNVISKKERVRFMDDFYSSHPDCLPYKELVDPFLESYIDKLSNFLERSLTTGEKFLGKQADEIRCLIDNIDEKINTIIQTTETVEQELAEIKAHVVHRNVRFEELMTRIDKSFVEANKTSDINNCRETYYIAKSAPFSAIINEVIEKPDEYEIICQEIYDKSKENPVVFVMADGGTGKSTIVCDVALRAAKDGHVVYWADDAKLDTDNFSHYELNKGNEEVFFVIDNALDNALLIEKLYLFQESSSRVHFILSDRTHRINNLVSELEAPYWITNGIAFVLNNRSEKTVVSRLKPGNIDVRVLSDDYRRIVSCASIDAIIDFRDWDKNIAAEIKKRLSYSDRSITEILLDFEIEYGNITGENIYGQKGFDWDSWDEVYELRGTFRYLAALIKYGVRVPIRQLEKVSGKRIELSRLIYEGKVTVAKIKENGQILLRHETVADNYFAVLHFDASEVIREMIENRLFTEDVLVDFEKKVFSLSNIYNATDEVKGFRIPLLISDFYRSNEIKEVLISHRRIHSLELAKLSVDKNFRKIGESYQRIKEYYSNRESLWMTYYFYAIRNEVNVPQELLADLNRDGLFKKVTRNLDDFIRKNYRNFDKNERQRWLINSEELFRWIIDNINKQDIPSRILLLWIYQKEHEIEKAKNIVDELSDLPETAKKASEFSVAYIQTFENEIKQLVKKDRNDSRIRETNRFIREYYEDLIEKTERGTDEYITIMRCFIRFLKDTGHYDEAYDFAVDTLAETSVIAPNVSVHRIYIELGMICQYANRRNVHFNHFEAIEWFTAAIQSMKKATYECLYALKPLCKSLLYVGKYDECFVTCESIRRLDHKDKEIDVLICEALRLKRIKEFNLPVGNKYRWEDKPKPNEVEYVINELLCDMTDEQMMYVKLFELENHKGRAFAYRALYSIKNNTFIPNRILSKLQILDKQAFGMMLKTHQL